MEPDEWTTQFAERLGLDPPTEQELNDLLDLAGVAAHASARRAAPVATWLIGRSGRSAGELMDLAREING